MEEKRKLRLYLDQNILSDIVKGQAFTFTTDDRTVIVPIYSHAHLEELANWSDETLRDLACSWLTQNGAKQVQLAGIGSEAGGIIDLFFKFAGAFWKGAEEVSIGPDRAFLVALDPATTMRNLSPQFGPGSPRNAMLAMGLKMAGGHKGENFAEVLKSDPVSFDKVYKDLLPAFEELKKSDPEKAMAAQAMMDRIASADSDISAAKEKLVNTINSTAQDERNFGGIPDFRKNAGLDPAKTNNISPPGILENIWKLMQEQPDNKITNGLSFEQFWGLGKNDDPSQESLTARVVKIHTQLNFAGYWPDDKLQEEEAFIAAARDGWHLSSAMFCHVFITRDKRLFKKAEAVYEQLGIPTRLGFLENGALQWSKINGE